MIDLVALAAVVYGALILKKRASKAIFYTYLFFSSWAILGLLTTLQIIPIDMTASESWVYFSIAGVLGMLGVLWQQLAPRLAIDRRIVFTVAVLIVLALGIRTGIRGADWKNSYTIAAADISNSKDDYTADDAVAIYYFDHGDYLTAKSYATRSVAIFPTAEDEATLGGVLATLGDYSGAYAAFTHGLTITQYYVLDDDLATLTLYYGNPARNQQSLTSALQTFPHDSKLWYYLALQQDRNNDTTDAQVSIINAARYGSVPSSVSENILNNRPFSMYLSANGQTIQIP